MTLYQSTIVKAGFYRYNNHFMKKSKWSLVEVIFSLIRLTSINISLHAKNKCDRLKIKRNMVAYLNFINGSYFSLCRHKSYL